MWTCSVSTRFLFINLSKLIKRFHQKSWWINFIWVIVILTIFKSLPNQFVYLSYRTTRTSYCPSLSSQFNLVAFGNSFFTPWAHLVFPYDSARFLFESSRLFAHAPTFVYRCYVLWCLLRSFFIFFMPCLLKPDIYLALSLSLSPSSSSSSSTPTNIRSFPRAFWLIIHRLLIILFAMTHRLPWFNFTSSYRSWNSFPLLFLPTLNELIKLRFWILNDFAFSFDFKFAVQIVCFSFFLMSFHIKIPQSSQLK